MVNFIPEKPKTTDAESVPYFEDAQSLGVPGRGTGKSVKVLQKEIVNLLAKLDAVNVIFTAGLYPVGKRTRYGFQITFVLGAIFGRIDCAALPIRKETPAKKDRAIAQALFLLRDELQASYYASIHKPNSVPLLPYFVGPGNKTVTENMIETQRLLLPASLD